MEIRVFNLNDKKCTGMDKSTIHFIVYGKAETAGSKKAFTFRDKSSGKTRASVTDDNPKTKSWQGAVTQEAAEAMRKLGRSELIDAPLNVVFLFHIPRPRSHFGTGRNSGVLKGSVRAYPDRRPDALKLARAAEDACTGVIWTDDARIVDGGQKKVYGEPARMDVFITELPVTVREARQWRVTK